MPNYRGPFTQYPKFQTACINYRGSIGIEQRGRERYGQHSMSQKSCYKVSKFILFFMVLILHYSSFYNGWFNQETHRTIFHMGPMPKHNLLKKLFKKNKLCVRLRIVSPMLLTNIYQLVWTDVQSCWNTSSHGRVWNLSDSTNLLIIIYLQPKWMFFMVHNRKNIVVGSMYSFHYHLA